MIKFWAWVGCLVAGGLPGWSLAVLIMELGWLGTGYRVLGLVLCGVLIAIATATAASIEVMAMAEGTVSVVAIAFALCASIAGVHSLMSQIGAASWLAVVGGIAGGILDMVLIRIVFLMNGRRYLRRRMYRY